LKKTAFLFPGQGSQKVGMGRDLFEAFDYVRGIYDMAEEICRLDIKSLSFQGPMGDLTQTVNLQPAITAVNLACLAAMEKNGGPMAQVCAVHSLGEFSALKAAGIISAEDTLRLVFRRGELMHREAQKHQGAMQAVIGLSIGVVQEVVAAAGEAGIVSVANHNTAEQIVITGEPKAVKAAAVLAKEKGGKAIPLKVSGAWHSHLIQGAEEAFGAFLDTLTLTEPNIPVIHNVSAATCGEPAEIRQLLAKQLCSPVRWFDSMQVLMEMEMEVFVEVGPGKVLAGLLKKILPKDHPAKIYNVGNMKQLEKFLKDN
jgi:[acyl-carrier-protein] S-malonyltransferase